MKMDSYNFDLYRFKVVSFFETQCTRCEAVRSAILATAWLLVKLNAATKILTGTTTSGVLNKAGTEV